MLKREANQWLWNFETTIRIRKRNNNETLKSENLIW